MSQQASQDNRMQISRWTNEGKEKKIYVYWDLYIMFNFMDEGRKRHSNSGLTPDEHLKAQIDITICSSNSSEFYLDRILNYFGRFENFLKIVYKKYVYKL